MRNLLAADFARLRRDRALWLICILYGLFSLVISISGSASAEQMAQRGYVVYAEEYFYAAVPGARCPLRGVHEHLSGHGIFRWHAAQ